LGFLNYVKLWDDVLDPGLDEKTAPSLGEVFLGRAPRIYADPREFFRRTLLTKSMLDMLEEIAGALAGVRDARRSYRKVHVLTSLFGGGKTHTLLTIYHAFTNPKALIEARTASREDRGKLEAIVKLIEGLGGVRVVVVDGFFKELSPTPLDPYVVGNFKIQTIWGFIAFHLGSYSPVEAHDKSVVVPHADTISNLLGRPTLILVDEVARYTVNLATSGDQRLRDYANQIIAFMELLAKAVDLVERSVLVVSLPVDIERWEVEAAYKGASHIVEGLYKALTRVAASTITPVTPGDIARILKTRTFERVDESGARITASKLAKAYQSPEYRELFGDTTRVLQELHETYPFHPTYVKTISEIVDKHDMLQKTRDAVKLTRKILRMLRGRSDPSELIMPYHVDVEESEIQAMLLVGDYRGYTLVVEEDIRGRCSQYDVTKQGVAKAIAKAVFAKTFVYQWAGGASRPTLFPDSKEVLLSSYEPGLADMLQATPKDYFDALTWLSRNLAYMLEDGGRYWFTYLVSPVREVEILAKSVEDAKAYRVLEDYATRLLGSTVSEALKARRPPRHTFKVFSDAIILSEPEPLDVDAPAYRLLVSLKPLSDSDVYRLVFETRKGARRHANTVYLIYPGDVRGLQQTLWHAKRLIACDDVRSRLDQKYGDKIVREVMQRKLEEYCRGSEGVEGQLLYNILSSLNTVAYPTFKNNRDDIEKAQAIPGTNIVESALKTLKGVRPQKHYEELDFDTLDYMLRQIGVDLKEGDLERRVREVLDYFYTNPRLPMVSEDQVRTALLEGVRRLSIGVRRGDEIYYKKVVDCRPGECRPPTVVEGNPPPRLQDDDVILPWPKALEEQVKTLRDSDERVEGGIRRIRYYFYIEGKLYSLREAAKSFDLDLLRYAPIVKVIEILEEGVDLRLRPQEVKARPGEELEVEVIVERIGEFTGEVTLEVSHGVIGRRKLTVDERSSVVMVPWRVRAPETAGEHKFTVRALGPGGRLFKEALLKVIVEREEICLTGAPPAGTRISNMFLRVEEKNLRPLEILINRFGDNVIAESASIEIESEAQGIKSTARVELERHTLADVKKILVFHVNHAGVFLRRLSYELRITPRVGNYVIAPQFDENEKGYLRELKYCKARG
jgi:predicted AAA+ superfamily ATPase